MPWRAQVAQICESLAIWFKPRFPDVWELISDVKAVLHAGRTPAAGRDPAFAWTRQPRCPRCSAESSLRRRASIACGRSAPLETAARREVDQAMPREPLRLGQPERHGDGGRGRRGLTRWPEGPGNARRAADRRPLSSAVSLKRAPVRARITSANSAFTSSSPGASFSTGTAVSLRSGSHASAASNASRARPRACRRSNSQSRHRTGKSGSPGSSAQSSVRRCQVARLVASVGFPRTFSSTMATAGRSRSEARPGVR